MSILARRATVLALFLLALLVAPAAPATPAGWPLPPPFGATWAPRAAVPLSNPLLSLSDPARNRLYVAQVEGDIVIVDTAAAAIIDTIPITAAAIALSPAGDQLYAIAHIVDIPWTASLIHVIDTAQPETIHTYPYACHPGVKQCQLRGFAAGPDGLLYVVRPGDQYVDVIDPAGGRLVRSLMAYTAGGLAQIEVIGDILYVLYGATLSLYDISGPEAVHLTFYQFPGRAGGMTPAPDGSFLVVRADEEYYQDLLYQFDVEPFGLARVYDGGHAYGLPHVAPGGTIIVSTLDYPADHGIIAIDAATGAAVRFLSDTIHLDSVGDVQPLAGGGIALLALDETTLLSPAGRAAALPLIVHTR